MFFGFSICGDHLTALTFLLRVVDNQYSTKFLVFMSATETSRKFYAFFRGKSEFPDSSMRIFEGIKRSQLE